MGLVYKNRLILNQRGGSLDIDGTTEQEKVKLSQRSGSNISLTNVVNSELATNNKQTNVVHDLFETVGNDKTVFTGGDYTHRVGNNSYVLKGFINPSEIESFDKWKATYDKIARINSQFKIKRGGEGFPNGDTTELEGERSNNPVIGSKTYTVENKFNGYTGIPIRKSTIDGVTIYATVPDKGTTKPAETRDIKVEDIEQSAGTLGSNAPGVMEFGASKSAATENGEWMSNDEAQQINEEILKIQDELIPIEQSMGEGDETLLTKRNRYEQIGAIFNDYPSIRIDEKGRSQPLEMLVSETGVLKNHDYIPQVEEVDNSSNFPCGNDDAVIGNRFSRVVGSGGVQLKTTGSMELGSSTLKVGAKKININASHGIQIASESSLDLISLKTITLRTNRQVYIESSLGVRGNAVLGGGIYAEGEVYCHHITAPLEVQQTQDTIAMGKFATATNRSLVIGEAQIGGVFYPVYALKNDDLIINYPHSHHFNNIPLRLTQSNKDVRNFAASENMNAQNNIAQALPQIHERKLAQIAPSP
jgi:hypothetical protein